MKLLERVRDVALRPHLARSTIQCYQLWIADFLRFSRDEGRWREPPELGATEVGRWITKVDESLRLFTAIDRCAERSQCGGKPQ